MTLVDMQASDLQQADVVVSGLLKDYEIIQVDEEPRLGDYAILTIDVQDSLKGNSPRTLQLTWVNSTFGPPDRMNIGSKVLVAGSNPLSSSLPLRGTSATILPAARIGMPQVLQAPCSTAFLLPYSTELESDLRAILAGKEVTNLRYSDLDFVALFDGKPARVSRERISGPVIVAIGLAILAILALLVGRLFIGRIRSR